ncbi:MAG: NADH-quinone oxidoreductase subunit C [Dehalococcoidia bacterium]|nr:NADH-quinone oxidoreductase subunit C [Dehalococcoidia bacterium]
MPRGPRQLDGREVAQRLRAAMPDAVAGATDEWVEVAAPRVAEVLRWLHDDPALDAAQLSSLCSVDRYDRFELVYHLQSLDQNHLIVVKAVLDREQPSLPSVYGVYRGALLQEREVYDLMGIHFEGHPDLRRLFLWEGFPGHPLRKNFLQIAGHHPGLPRFPFEEPGKQAR